MLEVAVFNIESAIQAEAAGANRLELCENPNEGGTTPSYGTLSVVSSTFSNYKTSWWRFFIYARRV
jgi:copper homeostasis protein